MKWHSRGVTLEQRNEWCWVSDGDVFLSVADQGKRVVSASGRFEATCGTLRTHKHGTGPTAEAAMRACDAACEREALALAPWLVKL